MESLDENKVQDMLIKFDLLRCRSRRVKKINLKEWFKKTINLITVQFDKHSKAKLDISLSCQWEPKHYENALVPFEFKWLLDYANRSKDFSLVISGRRISFDKLKNQICKIIATTDACWGVNHFEFKCISNFNKLINSMCTLTRVWFHLCIFTFKGECKLQKARKFKLSQVNINVWYFSENNFYTLIKILAEIAKSWQFLTIFKGVTVTTQNPFFRSFCEKFKMGYVEHTDKILIRRFSFSSSLFEDMIQDLE